MKERLNHTYDCLDKLPQAISCCNDQNLKNLLEDMRDLIIYQMKEIRDQRIEIVSIKHQNAWKHYDKPIDSYDPATRKYVDKPPKSGNMSC